MALFTKKTTATKKKEHTLSPTHLPNVLLRPWISEKAMLGGEKGVYVFHVSPRATKTSIKEAITVAYKVTPRMVRIVNTPGKNLRVQARRGAKRAHKRTEGKKAYVYLKKGDTISLF